MHHRGFRPDQGYPREEERARGTAGGGGAEREGSNSHTLTHNTHMRTHSVYHSRLSEASGSLPDHYLPYLLCDDDDGPSLRAPIDPLAHTHVDTSPYSYPHFYSHLELPASRALTSRIFQCAHIWICACRCALAHWLLRRGGDRASARSAAAG